MISYDNSGLSFFPPLTETCSPSNFHHITESCSSGLIDTSHLGIFQLKDRVFQEHEYKEIINQASPYKFSNKMASTYPPPSYTMLNPGVPVIIIYSKSIPTQYKLTYPFGTKEFIETNIYPTLENTFVPGDGSIPVNYVLFPGIKWAFQFDKKGFDDQSKYVILWDFFN
jgi:hypothetical protein